MADNGYFSGGRKLRLITYMVPGVPLELYTLFQQYLEETLNCHSYLVVETRWSFPPTSRVDPFTADEVDIGFMCSSGYLAMKSAKNQYMELVQAAPVHIHPSSELRPIYFSEVIIHKEKEENYKEFNDLKGHRWAYNDELSLSGSIAILAELHRMGHNATFFGHLINSGSHKNSIELVLNKTADGAAIDSTTLAQYFLTYPEAKKKIHVMRSLGPYPTPPIIFNSRLPDSVKQLVTEALLNMHQSPKWQPLLDALHVWGLKPIDDSIFDKETDIKEMCKNLTLTQNAYY